MSKFSRASTPVEVLSCRWAIAAVATSGSTTGGAGSVNLSSWLRVKTPGLQVPAAAGLVADVRAQLVEGVLPLRLRRRVRGGAGNPGAAIERRPAHIQAPRGGVDRQRHREILQIGVAVVAIAVAGDVLPVDTQAQLFEPVLRAARDPLLGLGAASVGDTDCGSHAGGARDDVHDPADRVEAVDEGGGRRRDLDPLDALDGHREIVEVEGSRRLPAHPMAVDQHEHLPGCRTPQRERHQPRRAAGVVDDERRHERERRPDVDRGGGRDLRGRHHVETADVAPGGCRRTRRRRRGGLGPTRPGLCHRARVEPQDQQDDQPRGPENPG